MTWELEEQRRELIAQVQSIDLQFTQRRTALDELHDECKASGNMQPWYSAKTQYSAWRTSALKSRQHALDTLREVKNQIRTDNIVSDDETYAGRYWTLRRAVQAHRQKTLDAGYAATGVDLELWAVLDVEQPHG